METLFFGKQGSFLVFELTLGNFAICSHINEVVYSAHTRLIFTPLVAVDLLSVRNLFLVHLFQSRHSPFFEIGRDLQFRKLGGYLLFKLAFFYGLLDAIRVPAFCAVIVSIAMHIAVFLMLGFYLGGNHTSALAASYRPAICDVAFLCPRLRGSAEQKLYPFVFFAGHQWFMNTFVPVAASYGILKLSVIKRPGKNVVDITSAHFLAIH